MFFESDDALGMWRWIKFPTEKDLNKNRIKVQLIPMSMTCIHTKIRLNYKSKPYLLVDGELRDKWGDGDDVIIVYVICWCTCVKRVTCMCSTHSILLFIVPLSRIFSAACMEISRISVHHPTTCQEKKTRLQNSKVQPSWSKYLK